MSNSDLLANGLKLLVFGMGMVYLFLVVMIVAITVMGRVVKPWIAEFESKPAASKPAPAAADDSAIVAAAVAAVALRRR